jgi:Holliday junction resolvase-like predicted endonuclease
LEYGSCAIHRKTFLKNLQPQELGKSSEEQAAEYLLRNGFKILHRNWTHKGGEIDIIAEKKGKLHFVEVRARSGAAEIEMTFPESKRKQFKKCVQLYFHAQPKRAEQEFHMHFFQIAKGKIQPFWDVFAL